jgi:hypothetical protein
VRTLLSLVIAIAIAGALAATAGADPILADPTPAATR